MFLYWHKIRKPKEYKVRHGCREHWKTPVTWSYSLLLSRAVVRWNVSSRGVGPRGRHLKRYQPVGQTELECVAPHPDLLILPRSGPYTQTRPLKFAYNFARISCNKCRKPQQQSKLDHRHSCGFFFQLIKDNLSNLIVMARDVLVLWHF